MESWNECFSDSQLVSCLESIEDSLPWDESFFDSQLVSCLESIEDPLAWNESFYDAQLVSCLESIEDSPNNFEDVEVSDSQLAACLSFAENSLVGLAEEAGGQSPQWEFGMTDSQFLTVAGEMDPIPNTQVRLLFCFYIL